jgi:hypothetical protein
MLELLSHLSQVLAALGVGAAVLAALRRVLQQRRWDRFKQRASEWTDDLLDVGIRLDKRLTEIEWQSECEVMLTDVGFTPLEIHQILDVAVIVAKGIASTRFLT